MTDTVRKPTEGYLKIESFNREGKLIDTYETPNMIMKLSKASVAEAIKGTKHTGINDGSPTPIGTYENYISSFVLGNGGSVEGDLLTPRTFSFARTELFAEENYRSNTNPTKNTKYNITFDPGLANVQGNGATPVVNEDAASGVSSQVFITTQDASTIKYIIDIPADNANGPGQAPIAWSEVALYTQEGQDLSDVNNKVLGKIFAMRTFPAKIKDTSTSFKITWKIVF